MSGPPDDLRRAALRGTFWAGIRQAGDRGIRLPVYLILARFLEPASFGLVALALVYIDFVQLFMQQGLTAAIVQREDLEREHLDSAFWGNIAFALVLGIGSWAAAGPVATVMGQAALKPIVQWLAPMFLLSALNATQDAIMRRDLRFQTLAVRAIGGQVVAGIAAIVLAVMGFGIWALVAMELLYAAVGSVLLWTASRWRPRLRFSARHYRDLLAFGINILGVNLLRYARNRVDHLLIGGVFGITALGYYSMGRTFVNGLSGLVGGSIHPVVYPTFARLQRDGKRLARAIYQAAELQALVLCPAFIGVAAVAPEVVRGLLGERWEPSIPIIQAFGLAAIMQGTTSLNVSAITAIGAPAWRVRLEFIIAAGTLIAMTLALPAGYVAVAWAFTASLVLLVPIELLIAVRLLPIRIGPYLRQYLVPLSAALAMWGAVALARLAVDSLAGALLQLAVLVLLGALVYGLIILVAARGVLYRAWNNLKIAGSRDVTPTDLEATA